MRGEPSGVGILRRLVAVTAAAVTCAGVPALTGAAAAAPAPGAAGDAVVVAVIDGGFAPYHWDMLAAKAPAAVSSLPLSQPPDRWLPGFPKPERSFSRYAPVRLTLDARDPDRSLAQLHEKDAAAWAAVKASPSGKPNYYWFPGTKVIGAVGFDDPAQASVPVVWGEGGADHGMGTTSVSVGNRHGTCPECLLVFLQANTADGVERALAWAESQPWIDVISNSYGLQTVPSPYVRDGLYGGPVTGGRKAVERGQTIVFSSGNGLENQFIVPTTTLSSSLKGPDWIITVGATSQTRDASFSGSGVPVDVAGIGRSYPSAYGAVYVNGGGQFSGTSNAAPTVAGEYARALWRARRVMAGASRVQKAGVVSVGAARCGALRRDCEVGDGRLTAAELRARLLLGAQPRSRGLTPGGQTGPGPLVPWVADERFAYEGHGTYVARSGSDKQWLAEFEAMFGPVIGAAKPLPRPAGEPAWFRVHSWCRQHIYGAWSGGAYRDNAHTPLPAPSPDAPVRVAYQQSCNALMPWPLPGE